MRKLVLLLVGGGLVALLATIMVIVVTDTSPTQAAGHKTTICHYDGGKVTQNKVHRDHSWSWITINTSAVETHVTNHAEPAGDGDIEEGDGGFDEADCNTRDGNLVPLEADGPPGQD